MQGQGVAVVRVTGINTEIGKIGKALQKVTSEETALQKETNLLVRNLAILGLSLCLLVVIAYGMTRGDWLQELLAGITMAKSNVLTRRVPAIETLGSATVLCVDKTGTYYARHCQP